MPLPRRPGRCVQLSLSGGGPPRGKTAQLFGDAQAGSLEGVRGEATPWAGTPEPGGWGRAIKRCGCSLCEGMDRNVIRMQIGVTPPPGHRRHGLHQSRLRPRPAGLWGPGVRCPVSPCRLCLGPGPAPLMARAGLPSAPLMPRGPGPGEGGRGLQSQPMPGRPPFRGGLHGSGWPSAPRGPVFWPPLPQGGLACERRLLSWFIQALPLDMFMMEAHVVMGQR